MPKKADRLTNITARNVVLPKTARAVDEFISRRLDFATLATGMLAGGWLMDDPQDDFTDLVTASVYRHKSIQDLGVVQVCVAECLYAAVAVQLKEPSRKVSKLLGAQLQDWAWAAVGTGIHVAARGAGVTLEKEDAKTTAILERFKTEFVLLSDFEAYQWLAHAQYQRARGFETVECHSFADTSRDEQDLPDLHDALRALDFCWAAAHPHEGPKPRPAKRASVKFEVPDNVIPFPGVKR